MRLHNKFAPTLEVLESRQLLAFNITQLGSALTLTGSSLADVARIDDRGNGQMDVTQDGSTTSYTGVASIKVLGNAGDDDVVFAQNDVATNKLVVALSLGTGNDKFFADIKNVESSAPENLTVNVNGGDGDDDLFYCSEGPVPAGHRLVNVMDGGNGNDSVRSWVLLADTNAGQVAVNLSGGEGNDTVLGLFSHDYLTVHNTGTAYFLLNGNNGNDTMLFTAADTNSYGLVNTGLLSVASNGGNGDDTFTNQIGASGVPVTNTGTLSLVVNGNTGNDNIDTKLGLLVDSAPTFTNQGLLGVTVNGGLGNDVVTVDTAVNNSTAGARYNGTIFGGLGRDTITFLARSTGIGKTNATVFSGLLDDSITATAIVNVLFARRSRVYRVGDGILA